MSISRQAVEDMVKEGLVRDIFRFERARFLQKEIHTQRENFAREGAGNFGLTFHAIHYALTTEGVLSVARIYDKPSKQYPTRCIKGLFAHLSAYATELPQIREPYQLKLALKQTNTPNHIINLVDLSPEMFPVELSHYIEAELSSDPLATELSKLKSMRDKVLAHNEKATLVQGPAWNSLDNLVELAKSLVSALGWAYFNTAYSINGNYVLSEDARRPATGLSRIMERLYAE